MDDGRREDGSNDRRGVVAGSSDVWFENLWSAECTTVLFGSSMLPSPLQPVPEEERQMPQSRVG